MFNFGVLRLCFGIFLLPSTRQFNLAPWKDTKQDSVFSDSIFLSGDAVNGNRQQDMENTSCSHTSLNRKFNWWTVDLGQQYLIDNIIIYGRDDCCEERLSDFDIIVYDPEIPTWDDYNKSTQMLCYHHNGVSPNVLNITCQTSIKGKYLQVYKDNGVDNADKALTLCEVEVYGKNVTEPKPILLESTTTEMISTDGIQLNQTSTWTSYNSVEMTKEVQTSLFVETKGVQTTLVVETTEAQISHIVETSETLTILVIETTEALTSRVVVATESSYNLNVVTTPAPTSLDHLYALLLIPFIVLLILALLFRKYCYRKNGRVHNI